MDYKWLPSLRQDEANEIVLLPEDNDLLYGGAKGGGKSYWLCHIALMLCLWIIDKCNIIERPKFPYPVGFLGRKIAKDFKTTTLVTWKKFIPYQFYEIKGDPAVIVIDGKVQIDTGGLDSSEAVNKFNSAEYMFYGIDQAEETSIDDVSVLRGSLRGQINGEHIPYKGLFTANPANCWLKNEFILSKLDKHYYVPALPDDNPHLPEGYTDTLIKAFKHRPELLAAYLRGSWDVFDDAKQVIRGADLEAAEKIRFAHTRQIKFIAVDPARFGDDETVMFLFDNDRIIGQKIFGKIPSDRLNNELHAWAVKENVDAVVIEENGLGGPICDWASNLAAGQYEVITVDVNSEPENETRFTNRRAEMWWTVSEQFANGDLSLHAECMGPEDYQRMKSQLCAPHYDFHGRKIKLEKKKETKKRLGSSPDRGDCAVIGWSSMNQITPKKEITERRERKRRKKRSAMAA